jgi:hypothetical protein
MDIHDVTEISFLNGYEKGRKDAAREIFEEIEKISKAPYGYLCLSNDEFAELKKKYTEN